MKLYKNKYVLPVLILLVALLSSILIYVLRSEQYKDWTSAPGVILKIQDVRNFNVRIYYAYTVDGKSYNGDDLFGRSSESKNEEGQKVTVWYDPDHPSSSSFFKPHPGLDPYGPFFLGIPLSIAVLLGNRRKNQP